MAPFVPIAASVIWELARSLLPVVPEIARTLGSGSRVSERNIAAAEKIISTVTRATGAVNGQQAVERVLSEPSLVPTVREALVREAPELFELRELGGGIAAARDADERRRQSDVPLWRSPAFVVTVLLLAPVYGMFGVVLLGTGFTADVKNMVVQAGLQMMAVAGAYWLGSSASSARKDNVIAADRRIERDDPR